MKNGLYKASFETQIAKGSGIVVISDGTIKGGDSSMYYVGSFQENKNQINASLRVGKHSDTPGLISVFGLNDVNAKLQGTSTGNTAMIQGYATEAPTILLKAQLTLIE
jgi:hypothetical protein